MNYDIFRELNVYACVCNDNLIFVSSFFKQEDRTD